jgi:hypothetical protein
MDKVQNPRKSDLPETFPIQNDLQQDALSLLLFSFASEFVIRKKQEIHVAINRSHLLLIYVKM